MQVFNMNLNSPWFELVKNGSKIYEGRRKSIKYDTIKTGDIIEFSHHTNKDLDSFQTIVEDILVFPTFEDALTSLDINKILPIPGITVSDGVEIYKKFVSIPTQIKDGIIMIKIKLK